VGWSRHDSGQHTSGIPCGEGARPVARKWCDLGSCTIVSPFQHNWKNAPTFKSFPKRADASCWPAASYEILQENSRTVVSQSNPSNAGTEHLVGRETPRRARLQNRKMFSGGPGSTSRKRIPLSWLHFDSGNKGPIISNCASNNRSNRSLLM